MVDILTKYVPLGRSDHAISLFCYIFYEEYTCENKGESHVVTQYDILANLA